jgi:hypothetical protein
MWLREPNSAMVAPTPRAQAISSMPEILSLKRARKAKERAEKQMVAAENRTKYGRTKAEKQREDAGTTLSSKKLDGHKRDT